MFCIFTAIEAQIKEIQTKKKEIITQSNEKGIGLLKSGSYYDTELYDADGGDKNSKFEGYVTSIAPNDDADEEDDIGLPLTSNNKRTIYSSTQAMKEIIQVCIFTGILSVALIIFFLLE